MCFANNWTTVCFKRLKCYTIVQEARSYGVTFLQKSFEYADLLIPNQF